MLLFFFRNLPPRALVAWGVALVFAQCLLMAGFSSTAFALAAATAAANPDADAVRQWQEMTLMFGVPDGPALAAKMGRHLGPWSGLVHDRLIERGAEPFSSLVFFVWETLGYMLFGMAALKSGFFQGAWPARRYRLIAAIGLAIAIPAAAVIAWFVARAGFTPEIVIFGFSAQTPLGRS